MQNEVAGLRTENRSIRIQLEMVDRLMQQQAQEIWELKSLIANPSHVSNEVSDRAGITEHGPGGFHANVQATSYHLSVPFEPGYRAGSASDFHSPMDRMESVYPARGVLVPWGTRSEASLGTFALAPNTSASEGHSLGSIPKVIESDRTSFERVGLQGMDKVLDRLHDPAGSIRVGVRMHQ
jgi:hypothetical protein